MPKEKSPGGLGGWLILVGLGIIIAPIKLMAAFLPAIKIFSDGTWEVLTVPGSESYNLLWGPIILGEMLINGGSLIVWLYVAFLFFSMKKGFPKWYIRIMVFQVAFILLDALAISLVLPSEPIFDPNTAKIFASALIGALIWVPYVLVSKRVKATFIE